MIDDAEHVVVSNVEQAVQADPCNSEEKTRAGDGRQARRRRQPGPLATFRETCLCPMLILLLLLLHFELCFI
jgi:hypothetical protein